jgi:hypothetical protein
MKNSKDFYSNCEKHNGVGGIVQNQEKPYYPQLQCEDGRRRMTNGRCWAKGC